MHIFLYGPPGSGKSAVGQALAKNLGLPFVDLDHVIEAKTGMAIPQIMEQKGEPAFRDTESSALLALADKGESVVALGGGALLMDESRAFAEDNGTVLLLTAESSTLLERLQNDPQERPLLAGDMNAKLSSLLAQRSRHYGGFPLLLPVDGKTVAQVAAQAQVILGRHHLSAMGEYDVLVQNAAAGRLGEMLRARGLQNPVIVTDENVAVLYADELAVSLHTAGFDPKVLTVPAGEAYKNMETVNRLWHGFLEAGLDRKSTVIALGGGVVGDMAGFAASTFMRGIPWVAAPSTLLAMVDASLGGKTGFDLPEGKNLIGSFYPPKLVLSDPQFLGTLPEAELRSGMAEAVKHGVISDPELFELCRRGLDWIKDNLEEVAKRAIAVKIKIIEEDPYERGVRAALNLGHTIGHAVELVSGFALRHGEAIAIGMAVEAGYSARVGLAGPGLVEALTETLSGLGLPVCIPKEMQRREILRAMRVDKKKDAKSVRFALPVEIGKVKLVDVTDLEATLDE
jgi:3-dehydroquinate synthase